MYAVIRSGGTPFKVAQGEVVKLPSIEGEVGGNIEFGEVLHLADGEAQKVGSPTVANAKVIGKIVRHGRDRKILVYKFKRRKGYEKRRGHRQGFTEVRIEQIVAGA